MTMSEIFSSGRKTTNGQTDGRIQQKSLKLEPRRGHNVSGHRTTFGSTVSSTL